MLAAGAFVADRYEVVGKIGSGGMSDVYKAKDQILGRYVAIKVLKQEFSEDVNFVLKFRTEAQSAAGLEHPNIVNIYDVGSENGLHYIVMEYVEGVTLKTYIEKKGRLTYKEAVSIAIQVGRGMEAAHAKNIIHRDIKPQNILISTEGKAKVTDFGIAKAVSNNTISSDVMGSVHYASPEQARNGFVDDKSDIYSLGIVMYEMITGRVPFDGETTVAVAIQHLQEDMVLPSIYSPDIPISLEKIILKCTQKSPDRRYGNASELLADLKQVLIHPDADFVKISDPSQNKTRVIDDGQVKEIRKARAVPKEKQREQYVEPEEEPEEDPEEEEGFLNPGLEKAVTIGGIVAAVIIVAIIIYLAGSIFGLFGGSPKKDDKDSTETELATETEKHSVISTEKDKPEQVTMIKVTGLTFEEAKKQLYEKKLGIQQAGSQASDEYEKGQIMSQDIEEGALVDVNTTIKVYISTGAAALTIPNVVGYDSDAAMKMLEDQDFHAERKYEFSDTAASGKVISQSPEGDTPGKKGDTVVLVVSQGKEAVVVPSVWNKPQEEAVNTLTQAGLTVASTSSEYSDTIPAGNVISQSITDGKYVDKGTSITLVVSLGSNKSYYYYEATISAPDSDEVVSARIVLTGSNGTQIQEWADVNISRFPYKISAFDIENCDTGTIKITWNLSDGSSREQTENVVFKKQ
ncbi:MAG: Stk1 family PASTA domain-containing Ser/Thr kinase [Lachnospiraceae bacterium]|nr:Stk1 family PASTA domain-containing Ser/Thr kinase [Lachnospiraceae bacterium]